MVFLGGVAINSAGAIETKIEFDSISLQRTGCFGTCPQYSVEIKADGGVTYLGTKDVAAIGKRNAKLQLSEIEFLSLAIKRAQFSKYAPTYTDEKDGCKEVWTDNPSLEISLNVKGTTKTVTYYLGCRGLPILDRLSWLAFTIDDVAQTNSWTGWKPMR